MEEKGIEKGFKLLWKRKGIAVSYLCSCWIPVGSGGIVYPIGTRVHPLWGNGALCLFKTLKDAINFRRIFTSPQEMEIWKAEYLPSKAKKVFRKEELYPMGKRLLETLPKGTCLARWIRITKRVR